MLEEKQNGLIVLEIKIGKNVKFYHMTKMKNYFL